MPLLHERLAEARKTLRGAGIDLEEATIDVEVLARHVLRWDRGQLLTRARDPVPAGFDPAFHLLIARRAAREPIAYIVGTREFWNLDFEVTPDVLIPRPETELLIEEAIECARRRLDVSCAIDVGTGSGCIAVAIAVEFPTARVVATDTSAAALDVARRNARRHGVGGRIEFVQTDVLEGVTRTAGLILSNPPYIPTTDAAGLQPEVARFEPAEALFAGPDGLDVVRRLLAEAPARLTEDGLLAVEFGFGQEPQVRALAAETGWTVVRVRADLQSIPRVAVLRPLRGA